MAKVVSGTKGLKKTQPVAVMKTGHPAVFRKIRCTACKVGYAVKSNVDKTYKCTRCGAKAQIATM